MSDGICAEPKESKNIYPGFFAWGIHGDVTCKIKDTRVCLDKKLKVKNRQNILEYIYKKKRRLFNGCFIYPTSQTVCKKKKKKYWVCLSTAYDPVEFFFNYY